MTIEDFRVAFKYYTITYMHKNYKQSYIEKRDSVNRRLYKFNFTIGGGDNTPSSPAKEAKQTEAAHAPTET